MLEKLAPYQKDLIETMCEIKAVKFGDFTLKSGRKSPFFVNVGTFSDAESMSQLAEAYARTIYEEYGGDVTVLFGPAYKAISIAACVALKLYDLYGMSVRYCSNRKEAKDHGDAGILVGSKLQDGDKVVIVEDVTTAGTSMEEVVPIIKNYPGVEILGLVVSIDRQEHGANKSTTALQEIAKTYGFKTTAILSMRDDVVPYLTDNGTLSVGQLWDIDQYYLQYGPKEGADEDSVEETEVAKEEQAVCNNTPCEENKGREEDFHGNPT